MEVAEFPLNSADLLYLKMAAKLAEKWFGTNKAPVEFIDARPHELAGHIIVVVSYTKAEDLFFLGAAMARLKEQGRMDKVVKFINHEIGELLTFRMN